MSVNKEVKTMTCTILASDPGPKNYGYAVVSVKKVGNALHIKVHENGKFQKTLHQLKIGSTVRSEVDAFVGEALSLCTKYQCHGIAAERFMPRGHMGNTIELVNIMIGALVKGTTLPLKIMPAATWKNAVTRAGVDLKAEYKKIRVEAHQLDATLIGIYTGCQVHGYKDFGPFDLKKNWVALTSVIEATTTQPLLNRRTKCSAV